jgi:hypothetical protein
MVWEAVFMLVLLKIPIVYLCMVVWWAIRAEPRDEQPAAAVPVSDTPSGPSGWTRPRPGGTRPGPERGPGSPRPSRRVARRPAAVRGELRR